MPVRFVLAGSGPEEARLRARVEAEGLAGRVVFAGFREDVAALLAAADLVVHPSHADALPTALIHALAAGVPAVATRVGGIPEIVGDDAGVLVPPAEPAALAGAVRDLAGDPGGAGRWARRPAPASPPDSRARPGRGAWPPSTPRSWARRAGATEPRHRPARGRAPARA